MAEYRAPTLPCYYLRQAEFALLEQHAGEIADRLGPRVAELGSGSAKKTQLLLSACLQCRPTTYLPIDVSREILERSATALAAELAGLAVHGLWGRYEAGLSYLRSARATAVDGGVAGQRDRQHHVGRAGCAGR